MPKRDRTIKLITKRSRLCNAKSRRSRNLFKKCWELSQLCGLKVTVLVLDEKRNHLMEYNSHQDYCIKQLSQLVQENEELAKGASVRQRSKLLKHKKVKINFQDQDIKDDELEDEYNKDHENHNDQHFDLDLQEEKLQAPVSPLLQAQNFNFDLFDQPVDVTQNKQLSLPQFEFMNSHLLTSDKFQSKPGTTERLGHSKDQYFSKNDEYMLPISDEQLNKKEHRQDSTTNDSLPVQEIDHTKSEHQSDDSVKFTQYCPKNIDIQNLFAEQQMTEIPFAPADGMPKMGLCRTPKSLMPKFP